MVFYAVSREFFDDESNHNKIEKCRIILHYPFLHKEQRNDNLKNLKKLGTLAELSKQLNTDRNGVMLWAREQARIETEKYKKERDCKTVLIPFHADRPLEYGKEVFYEGGYLFLQSIYY